MQWLGRLVISGNDHVSIQVDSSRDLNGRRYRDSAYRRIVYLPPSRSAELANDLKSKTGSLREQVWGRRVSIEKPSAKRKTGIAGISS